MRCRKVQRLLSRRLDGRSSTREGAAIDEHVAACSACRLAAMRMESAWRAIDQLERAAQAPDDWVQLVNGAAAARWGTAPQVPSRRSLPAMAGACLALAGMVALGAAAGLAVSRAAFPGARSTSLEAAALAETLGDLPWQSPTAGLARSIGSEGSRP